MPDRQQLLQAWVSAFGTPQQVALRCRIALGAAEGESARSDCRRARDQSQDGDALACALCAGGSGRVVGSGARARSQAPYGPEKIQAIVDATLRSQAQRDDALELPVDGRSQGVSKSTVNNIWQSHNLKPHRVKTFKLSRDAKFLEKLTDVVGLYLNPPQQAIVLCVDEKSQIQALDRTQPGLPLKKGRCGTMTHDYKRNGTTTLFAALEVLRGR